MKLIRGLSAIAISVTVVFLLLVSASAENPGRAAFVVFRADGSEISGRLIALTEGWSVHLGDREGAGAKSAAMVVPGDVVISLRRQGRVLPPLPVGEQIVLTNGDRIRGKFQRLAGDRIHFLPAIAPRPQAELENKAAEWILPLSTLAEIWIEAPDRIDSSRGMRHRLPADKRSRDVLLLRNGDALEGIVNSLDEKSRELQIDIDDKPVRVNLNRVAALIFNTELARSVRPKAAYGRAILDNGSRISLASARADAEMLTGKTLFGTEVKIDLTRILALDIFQGRAVYLSDLPPRSYEYNSYLSDLQWPFVADGNVAGGELRLGGSVFDKGLGMHSRSRLTYALEGKYQRFEATVGLDDRLGKQGTARIQVLVDGRSEVNRELNGRDGLRRIQVNLTGAKELTLVADFGGYGEVQGCVDWVDARLIK